VQKRQRIVVYLVCICAILLCAGCATGRGTGPDAWGDATLVAEQWAEIEQLRRDIVDMGEYQLEVSIRIDRITDRLLDGLGRCGTIEDIFGEIDRFVRDLIDENRKLRGIQPTNRRADAGEG
jgi:predicted small secreted protein